MNLKQMQIMKALLLVITQFLKVAALVIPAIFEYYSSRNMGVYRYLVAFNYHHRQYPFSASNVRWLGYITLVLMILFIWLTIKPEQCRPVLSRKLPVICGLISSTGLLAFFHIPALQSWYSYYLFLYGWLIVLLLSIIELFIRPTKSPLHQMSGPQ